jgi:broad specificity phosphatase PhoE
MSAGSETIAQRRIFIARHGSRLDDEDPSWVQKAERPWDPPLAPRGYDQARRLGVWLAEKGIDFIFSSPFLRALETAVPLADLLGLSLRIEPGLSEWLTPEWFPDPHPVLGFDQLVKRFPLIDRSYIPRGKARFGETAPEALQRSGEAALRLTQDFSGNLAVFGHGASMLGAVAGLLRMDPEPLKSGTLANPPPSCIAEVVLAGGKGRLHSVRNFFTNDTDSLK